MTILTFHLTIIMKNLLLLLALIAIGSMAYAQSTPLIYLYDEGGNRVQRRLITMNDRLADTTIVEEQPPVDLPAGAITAYPNPTGGLLHVAVSPTLLEEGNAQYWLFDLSGRILRDGTITQSIITLDLGNEAKGVYILKVVAGTKKEEWQVVRQ